MVILSTINDSFKGFVIVLITTDAINKRIRSVLAIFDLRLTMRYLFDKKYTKIKRRYPT
jgi:hypothetical protein